MYYSEIVCCNYWNQSTEELAGVDLSMLFFLESTIHYFARQDVSTLHSNYAIIYSMNSRIFPKRILRKPCMNHLLSNIYR